MTEFKLQVSAKDNEGDMVNFRADNPEELAYYLENFPYDAYATAKASLRGAGNLGGIVQPAQQTTTTQGPPPQSNGWGQQPQQQRPPQQGGYGAQLHPEGLTCDVAGCGKVLEFKKTGSGKSTWRCPDWRWNNGNPNGHRQEWAN